MHFNRNLNGAFVDPHSKRHAAEASEIDDVADDNAACANRVVTDFIMGVKLQMHEGTKEK
jgi:hypothetical protein